MLLVLAAEEKIFHVQDTDDVIRSYPLYRRKSGKFVFLKNNIDQFVVSIIYIAKVISGLGDHDLFC